MNIVTRGALIRVDVPVKLVGSPIGLKNGGLVEFQARPLSCHGAGVEPPKP